LRIHPQQDEATEPENAPQDPSWRDGQKKTIKKKKKKKRKREVFILIIAKVRQTQEKKPEKD